MTATDTEADEREGDHREVPDGVRAGALERRRYLQLLGVASLLGGGVVGSAAGEETGWNEGPTVELSEVDRDATAWEDAADERIETHRTAPLAVDVTDSEGRALEGAEVEIEMQAHTYGFGTAVNAPLLLEDSADADTYREYVPELFNKGVLENHHKWRFFEENQETADEATEWLLERGLRLRGHTCLWANVDAYAVPADVEEALEEGDGEHVRERTLEHIETIIAHYGDDIEEWDVVNEAIHETSFITAVDGSVNPVEAPILAEWYETAEAAAAEEGVSIAVNDYNVLVGPHTSTRNSYKSQIEFLLEEGIDLGAIGLQSHFGTASRLSPDEVLEALNEYAAYGIEIKSTEFDTYQGSWDSSEAQAEFFYEFLKTFYSHPATADFLMWGFWDGEHWGDDAPLFYEDWTPKPAYDVWMELVYDEWWTDEAGETDGEGTYGTQGFHGEYQITASYDGETRTVETTLEEGGTTVTVDLDVETESESDDATDSVPGLGIVSGLVGIGAGVGYALAKQVRTADADEEHT